MSQLLQPIGSVQSYNRNILVIPPLHPQVGELFAKEGVCAVAIIECGEVDNDDTKAYQAWLDKNNNAGMDYLGNHSELRKDPRLLLENARTLFSMAFSFHPTVRRAPDLPIIASYAYGDDYHDVLRSRLQKVVQSLEKWLSDEDSSLSDTNLSMTHKWRICIDSAPVRERYWALKSGLAKKCKNGMVSVEGVGSMVFLAEIITDVPIEYFIDSDFRNKNRLIDIESKVTFNYHGCESCGNCIKACPGGAIGTNGEIDARKCISYLTIEHKGDWDEQGKRIINSTGREILFGCDICLQSCPVNNSKRGKSLLQENSLLPEFRLRREYSELTREKIGVMTGEEFSQIFRKSPVKRAKISGIKRNIGSSDTQKTKVRDER